ncbi:MAG: electron transfer flavoprotein subunit alpha/FixB family protein [Desulfobacteraceae bacterium]|jgi:electron transfer flavoprotein alpha subunit
MNDKHILIIAELDEDRLKPVTFELSHHAKNMESNPDNILLVITGTAPGHAAREASERTGLDVLCVTVSGTEFMTNATRKDVVVSAAKRFNPSYILCPHSSEGTDYGPGLAVRLSAACISAVNGITRGEDGSLLFSRSICGGQYNALMKPDTKPAVILVQPGLFPTEKNQGEPGRIIAETYTTQIGHIRMTGIEKTRESSSELGQAKVIVAAGRGVGNKENLDAIRRFAALFPGAAVAGSRPLIDMGWLEYRYQVGITGNVVSPPVYIACGISGSTQHIAGMGTSGYVIAINSDPHAAIFNVSDLCIVDDIIGFIDAFEDFEKEE